MRTLCALALLAAACGGSTAAALTSAVTAPAQPTDGGTAEQPVDGGTAAVGPTLGGCPMFPASNDWNRDISADPVDPSSAAYVSFMGGNSLMLQPDFGGIYGQPFVVVPASQAGAPMTFRYATQSEPGPYPFPQDLPIASNSDRHATVLSQADCKLYETYLTNPDGNGGFTADSGAVFDLVSGTPRPDGWTSATAAGLPILPGMARYDEAAEQGAIRHALAFTAGATAHAYVSPATHSSGASTDASAPPLGLRVRLKASFDLSHYTGQALVVLTALKKYGMFLTDNSNGGFWAVAGSLDPRWNVQDLDQIKTVPTGAFEVVQHGPVHPGQ